MYKNQIGIWIKTQIKINTMKVTNYNGTINNGLEIREEIKRYNEVQLRISPSLHPQRNIDILIGYLC